MRFISIIWDDEANPNGNVQHIAEHELSIRDVEHVLLHPISEGTSRNRAGRLIARGYTQHGRYVAVVYEEVIEGTIRVRTACDVPKPKTHRCLPGRFVTLMFQEHAHGGRCAAKNPKARATHAGRGRQ